MGKRKELLMVFRGFHGVLSPLPSETSDSTVFRKRIDDFCPESRRQNIDGGDKAPLFPNLDMEGKCPGGIFFTKTFYESYV